MTNKNKWTAGPWAKDNYERLMSPKGKQVGIWGAGLEHVMRSQESQANANLIAAAPDLYDTLEYILGCDLSGRDTRKILDVMAKARGETL